MNSCKTRLCIFFIACVTLTLSSCTWTTVRPHLVASSLFDLNYENPPPVESEVFNQEMYRITGRRRHSNNQVLLLKNGEEIFPLLLELIAEASKSIYIDQYAFHGDGIGSRVGQALKESAGRGVEVLVIYDAVGSRSTPRSFWRDLEEHNIEVRAFNPIHWWTVIRANNRDHRKIILIDREVGLIGDFGIGKQYAGDGSTGGSWRVSALLIKGPAIGDLEEVFLESWEEAGHGIIKKDLPFPLVNIIWDIPFSFFNNQEETENGLQHPLFTETAGAVRIVSSTPNWGSTEMLDAFLLALASARETIYITQSYFIPNDMIRDALIDASGRGVDVQIILPQHPDVPLVKSSSELSYEKLLEGGVRIFERRGSMLHSKTMVIDGVWSTIGSCNIDDRSFLLNYECNAIVYDRSFGEGMEKMFADDLLDCEEITLDRWKERPWWKTVKNKLLIPFAPQL
jgi:cardiolipin synthase